MTDELDERFLGELALKKSKKIKNYPGVLVQMLHF